ncbi:MAG: N-6 DNA methylase [Oscillospiraceae bacterium]|nr:N-6 DNA methylase [Oscillospiraceae bacterium]
MITAANLKTVLHVLGFSQHETVFEKSFPQLSCSLRVDFSTRKLIYPDSIKGRERNDGFDQNENFVVFECVNRLLEKGYRPEHIELEKEWHLGHDAKGGRADICVSAPNGSMLFIVECKTFGREYDKANKDTHSDGGQLFSYWQQEQSCKWLILYTSDLKAGSIEYKAPTIDCSDDANIILLSKKDKSIKLYRDSNTAPDRFEVWKDTYASQMHDDLVFSEDSVAYQVGVKPLRKKNLRDFTPEDKIVNKFEEILRHNNVSDKENAFNRLVALFICKLVDESTKNEDDEVEFQYKQGTDTYESLQDRLQRLHRDGMEKFMREEILYVSADYPEWLFSTYTGSKRKKAIEDLQNTIRILKFYSNNDFAFKDVHNEELFYQNGKILVEMVQLFEKYRIVYQSKHQFLGDLFEQLLNKGFKQNEGQFFTPIPITRFIWDSLPVDRMLKSERGTVYPKVIDYACGAGHFLTEAIEAINFFAQSDGNNSWVRDHIYGIEKDYRLARVAKISLFMNGAGEGNIIFGDGLENAPDKGIENGTFDILVANPPYAVKDFKQHLQLKNNSFTLLDRIGMNGGEIETLFVERIAQLLKPRGIAAVILPSSILSNDSASYTGAREQLLQNFYIRGIAAFGSKTFGATGTNTVVMFLEKYNEPPKQIDLSADSVEAIFGGAELAEWKDKDILEAYLAQIEIDEAIYRAFLTKSFSIADLESDEYFKMYTVAFADSAEAKNLLKTKVYRNMTPEEQAAAYLEKFYTFTNSIEKEKLLYFSLVYHQTTVIITAPADNKAQKDFLGYDWSNRKGNEGIQILTPGGKLYDNSDRTAEGTLANAIKQSFVGMVSSFNDGQQLYGVVVSTKDMLDYSRVSFNKSIRITAEKKIIIRSKYPLKPIEMLQQLLKRGKSPTYGDSSIQVIKSGQARGYRDFDFSTKYYLSDEVELDERKLQKGDILINSTGVGTAGRVTLFDLDGDFVVDSHITIFRPNSQILPEFVLLVLSSVVGFKTLEKMADGSSGQIELSIETIKSIKIPVPPISIQQQVIDECAKIDEEYNTTRMSIDTYRQKIEALFAELDIANRGDRLSLSDPERFSVSIGKRVLDKELVSDGAIPVFSANVTEPFGNTDKLLITDFSVPSVLWGIDGDWMTSYMPEGKEFYPTDHCGVLRCKTNEVNPRYLTHILEVEGRKMGFSRSYRASIDRVQGISFSVPDIVLQNNTMIQIAVLEEKVNEAEEKLLFLNAKRTKVVQEFL